MMKGKCKKICKNCKWLLKIHEETININRYHCIYPLNSTEAKNNENVIFSKGDYTAFQTVITKTVWISLNKTCKYFEIRPKTTSYIRTMDVDFYDEYIKFLDKELEPITALEEERDGLKLAIDTIRNVVGIKIPEIDIKISKMDVSQMKKLIHSCDWYKNHYNGLNKKYQNLLKLLKEKERM